MEALFRTLPSLIREIDGSPEIREAVVIAAWRRIAGGPVAERTAPIALENKRLIIAVENKTWKRNLEDLSGQIVFKLNAALGQSIVEFIEFRIEPASIRVISPVGDTDIEQAENAALANLPTEVRIAAESIKHPAMRETFMLAAANCTARSGFSQK